MGRRTRIPSPGYTTCMHLHAAPASSPAEGTGRTQTVLRISLVATLAYVAVTFVAGLRAHSLALLSESGHNVSDFLALLLSFAAVYFQTRPADDARTFGYQRAGVLAAFINAGTLILISVWIGFEAVRRLYTPVAVQPRLMMYVAAAGVLMNGVIAALLWGVARDVNLRSAFIHMAGDTLSTAAVIAGGAGILLTGHNWIDPVLSLVIAALILWSSAGIVRETFNILLEGTPRGVDLPQIRTGMEGVPGVLNVHDLHCWSLGSQSRALACHVTIDDIPPSESAAILAKLRHVLKDHFNICHTTIQFEHENCEVIEGCVVPMEEMASSTDRGHHHGHAH
jgi:cobalt-zinc-cadmium efflux system protein